MQLLLRPLVGETEYDLNISTAWHSTLWQPTNAQLSAALSKTDRSDSPDWSDSAVELASFPTEICLLETEPKNPGRGEGRFLCCEIL